jgi:beta-lactam-binding protein with PASTA domain/tRNA A-37 threonylcarbamoyl transferase component Bud32
MATSDTLIDTVFDGRYRIVRRLGAGGMANVYMAEDEELDRPVAIKILNDRYANDELFVERFRREARSAAALSHPNIVSIYDRGEAEGTYYIAMEVIDGASLKELIRQNGRLRPAQAIAYTRQILSALRFAHKNGIVHRDIKPHNILIGAEERLKVTDFGIARAGASQMTEAGSIMGTAHYLSPEQARGAQVTAASDLYSVGVVLYEMLTGDVPFTGDTPVEIAMKHLNDAPRPPSARVPGIPADLDRIVMRALAKDPQDRYRSAEELDSDLARVEAGLPIARETTDAATAILAGTAATAATQTLRRPPQAPPAPPRRPPPYDPYARPPRRKRSIIPWIFVALLLTAAGIAGWYVYQEVRDQLVESQPVAVPNVVGITQENAVRLIENAELAAEVRRRADEEVSEGTVIEQSPQAGAKIAKGETVIIIVSSGLPQVTVPKVANLPLNQATQRLSDAGLDWRVNEVFSERVEAGVVISQDPRPEQRVDQGTTVTLRVSKGVQEFEVPGVIGLDQDSASAALDEAGFLVDPVTVASSEPAGIVVDQSPGGGATAPTGATIQISISEGPQTATVPDVVGSDQSSAEEALQGAGFGVDVIEQPTLDPNEDSFVIDQDPPGGSEVDPGATVTIVVLRFILEEPPPEEPAPAEQAPAEEPPAEG